MNINLMKKTTVQEAEVSAKEKIVLTLKMRGKMRDCIMVKNLARHALKKTLDNMSWGYTGSGKVDVEWELK